MNQIKSVPSPVQSHLKTVYPWEEDTFKITCYSIYKQALATGYDDTFEAFQDTLGSFFSSLSNITLYSGSYFVTPMANFEQILHTSGTILQDDVVVDKIPYVETSNEAGGYTVIIG